MSIKQNRRGGSELLRSSCVFLQFLQVYGTIYLLCSTKQDKGQNLKIIIIIFIFSVKFLFFNVKH